MDKEEGEKAEDEGKEVPDTAEREEESEDQPDTEAAEEAEPGDPRLETIQLRRRRSRGLLRGKRPLRKLREVDTNTQPR